MLRNTLSRHATVRSKNKSNNSNRKAKNYQLEEGFQTRITKGFPNRRMHKKMNMNKILSSVAFDFTSKSFTSELCVL